MRGDVRRAFRRLTRAASGAYQGPVRARVVKQEQTDALNHVDVQVLTRDDEPDANWPLIRRVEVPCVFWAGQGTGVYYKLAAGAVVRVAFYEGDVHRPYLDAVIGGGVSAPGLEFVINSNGAIVSVSGGHVAISAGTVSIASSSWTNVTAADYAEIYGEKVLLGGAGANQRLIRGDDFLVRLLAVINDPSKTKFAGSPIETPWLPEYFEGVLSEKTETE